MRQPFFSLGYMKGVSSCVIGLILFLGMVLTAGNVAVLDSPREEMVMNQSFDRLRHLALKDAATGSEENYGSMKMPEYQSLEVHGSDDPQFEYAANSPYYTAYFKGTKVRMKVGDAWIEYELGTQEFGEVGSVESAVDKNLFFVSNVFESVDLTYKVDTSLLTETLTIREPRYFERMIQKISWKGIKPEFEEDGSILFMNEEKKILRILPPFMKDAEGAVGTDLHYELVETETGYELHKVVDESGLKWLMYRGSQIVKRSQGS